MDKIREYRLDVPPMTQLAHMLRERGVSIREDVLTTDEVVQEVRAIAHQA
ncbi:MAG: hypothetical protein GX674_01525 [Clostridiales bacterium]|nr:hypothetical protein [Clostridiales bacterium]